MQVLHDFSNYLLAAVGSEELQEAALAAQMMTAAGPSIKHKRNSELLISLLGLPKNILKSGRK